MPRPSQPASAWDSLWGGDCYSSGPYGCSNPSSAAGWTLLIPVVGPVISSIVAPATSRQAVTYGLVWDLPWLLTDLPMQLVGLGLIIQGYKTPQHYLSRKRLSQLMVRPYSNQAAPPGRQRTLLSAVAANRNQSK